jgi:small subunit ribosomal protein S17
MSTTRKHQEIRGVVVSDKMDKTRVIEIKRMTRHGLYHKGIVRSTRFFVHDEKNESKIGDTIIAVSSRPLSKQKNFRLVKIAEKRVAQ